jgi:hypothetical protein
MLESQMIQSPLDSDKKLKTILCTMWTGRIALHLEVALFVFHLHTSLWKECGR